MVFMQVKKDVFTKNILKLTVYKVLLLILTEDEFHGVFGNH